jgi:hypothetical protein
MICAVITSEKSTVTLCCEGARDIHGLLQDAVLASECDHNWYVNGGGGGWWCDEITVVGENRKWTPMSPKVKEIYIYMEINCVLHLFNLLCHQVDKLPPFSFGFLLCSCSGWSCG